MARMHTVNVNARTADKAASIVRTQLAREGRPYRVTTSRLVANLPDSAVALFETLYGHLAAYRCTFEVTIERI